MKYLVLIFLLSSCLQEQKNIEFGEFTSIPKSGAPFFINDPIYNGKSLSLEIAYPGGCKEHVFKAKLESCDDNDLCTEFLHHNDNNDTCEAMVSKRYQFTLKEMGLKKEVPAFLLRPVFKNSKPVKVIKSKIPE